MNVDDRLTACMNLLRAAAIESGMTITGDLRVCEADAARLLCVAPGTLKNLRIEGSGPVAYRTAINGSRVSYRLHDLAAWIECGRDH